MIWSLIKVLVFIAIAAAITFGAGYILETPGEVRLAFAGREITLSPIGFILVTIVFFAALWVILKLAGLVVAIIRFLTGDETALSRYFDRNRERKGFEALTSGLMALAEGEGRKAQAQAARAERLLDRPELTRLISAQAAEMSGNTDRATAYYKDMLTDDRTRFVGVQGLLKQKLADGETDVALQLAKKAFALKPKHSGVLTTLFDLQSTEADWAGARRTLLASVKAGQLPKDVGRRREAVLSLADANAAMEAGNIDAAREAAYRANKQAPGFAPAALLAADLRNREGQKRSASSTLRKTWAQEPQPDLAAAFAALDPEETPEARRKRFQALLGANPGHPESRMVEAELALAAEDFPSARRALGDLATTRPTTRSLAIMAAIEKGEGSDDSVVKGWLTKALGAQRDEAWVCDTCKAIHSSWAPVCSDCGAFDTIAWVQPPHQESDTSTTAMLPLIVGALKDETGAEASEGDDPLENAADDDNIIDADVETAEAEPAEDHPKAAAG